MDLSKNRIAIIDDDQDILFALEFYLKEYFEKISLFNHPEELLLTNEMDSYALVLLDMNYDRHHIDGRAGLSALERIKAQANQIEVVVMTAYAEVSLAVQAVKKGAFDFVVKPWQNEKLLITIMNALQKRSLQQLLMDQQAQLHSLSKDVPPLIGDSEPMNKLRERIMNVANNKASVLIKGEKGSGKQLTAQHIHLASNQSEKAFISLDFSQLSPKDQFDKQNNTSLLLEKVQLAEGGTLLLKHIEKMNEGFQKLFYHFIQSNKMACRVISLTEHENVQEHLLEELFHFLSKNSIETPPLRTHLEDLEDLIHYFLEMFSEQHQKQAPIFHKAENQAFNHSWPSNIKELKRAVERLILLEVKSLSMEDLIHQPHALEQDAQHWKLEELEKNHIARVLKVNHGNILRSANDLGISRAALYRRIEKFGIA